ncbi:beta-propeller fold lactonase family protein [Novosphingobium sp. BL-8A]|uniref:lactonase family protein n=1 Tax=Novosphingobium sp. BL-8A TaxID=3127639 RepID=UPI003757DB49
MKQRLLAACAGLAALALPMAGALAQDRIVAASPNGSAAEPSCPQNDCLAPQLVYVGKEGAGGIDAARFDPRSGTISALGSVADIGRPTWLMPSPHRQVLYAANESANGGDGQGEVLSFTADPADGHLSLLSRVGSGGGSPRHLALAGMPPTIFVANFAAAQVAAIPLQKGGALLPPTSVVTDSGSGSRLSEPHAQAVLADREGKHLFVADFGADRIFVYHIDADSHSLSPSAHPFAALPTGSGPRRLAFSADGRFVYVLTEKAAQLVTLAWDAVREELRVIGSIPIVHSGKQAGIHAAELVLDRDGRFAYVTNRGDGTLVVYALDRGTGTPREIQRLGSAGREPTALAIDTTGRWLLVASAAPGSVSVFARNSDTGLIEPTPSRIAAPRAASLAMLVP